MLKKEKSNKRVRFVVVARNVTMLRNCKNKDTKLFILKKSIPFEMTSKISTTNII